MSRNFGLGSRDMVDAARIALHTDRKKGGLAFSSINSVVYRFGQFSLYAKLKGIGRMERVTKALVVEYGRNVAFNVEVENISTGYGHSLISAVNTVFRVVKKGNWESISPTKDCGLAKRCTIRKKPTINIDTAHLAIQYLYNQKYSSAAVVAELALYFGLRSKEASLMDVRVANKEVVKSKSVTISKGTKGGRNRQVTNLAGEQVKFLNATSVAQEKKRSLIPENENWKTWSNRGLRKGRDELHRFGIKGYHEFRALYAALRYEEMTGWKAPVNGGVIGDKQKDKDARMQIAIELGHNRIDVVGAYIGGRR